MAACPPKSVHFQEAVRPHDWAALLGFIPPNLKLPFKKSMSDIPDITDTEHWAIKTSLDERWERMSSHPN